MADDERSRKRRRAPTPPPSPGTECPICQRGGADARTPCGHMFHSYCLRQWRLRNGSCPMCRRRLPRIYRGWFWFRTTAGYRVPLSFLATSTGDFISDLLMSSATTLMGREPSALVPTGSDDLPEHTSLRSMPVVEFLRRNANWVWEARHREPVPVLEPPLTEEEKAACDFALTLRTTILLTDSRGFREHYQVMMPAPDTTIGDVLDELEAQMEVETLAFTITLDGRELGHTNVLADVTLHDYVIYMCRGAIATWTARDEIAAQALRVRNHDVAFTQLLPRRTGDEYLAWLSGLSNRLQRADAIVVRRTLDGPWEQPVTGLSADEFAAMYGDPGCTWRALYREQLRPLAVTAEEEYLIREQMNSMEIEYWLPGGTETVVETFDRANFGRRLGDLTAHMTPPVRIGDTEYDPNGNAANVSVLDYLAFTHAAGVPWYTGPPDACQGGRPKRRQRPRSTRRRR